jgi:hypothetical protein
MERELVLEHPSYGAVTFSRRQGNPRLFGSNLTNHYSYVTLLVKRAKLERGSTGDYLNAPVHGDVIEIDMSTTQFAELLTTMNIGTGVPCTIRRLMGERVEEPPDNLSEAESIRSTFKAEMKRFVSSIRHQSMVTVRDILMKKTVSQTDRVTILAQFESIVTKLTDYAPFIIEQFNEATGKITSAAKQEVDAAIQMVIVRGLAGKLGPLKDLSEVLTLKESNDDEGR